ncbi:MAG: DUF3352 domain-containing protein [Phycisphaerae bacterium]|nr:DUF3352 domain-containing protein [Phycisphaerae bacterium]
MKNAVWKNHKSSYALMLLCSYALFLLCPPAGVRAAELPKTAKLVPPGTVLLVNVEDFGRLKTMFEKTSLFKLYKDPAMKAFVEDFKTKWQEKVRESDNELAGIVKDAATLPRGRAAIAVVLDEKTEDTKEPPVVLITEWGENTGRIKEMVEQIVTKGVEEKDARRQTEDYRGIGITSVTGKSSGALSYCFIDDCLIVSANLETLKFVIAQAKGASSPTLADDDDYNATLRAVGPSGEGRIDIYVNIKQIIKTATAQDEAGKIKQIITNLGLDNVTSFGFSIDAGGGPGGTTSGKALLKIDGAKKGICKLLEVESAAVNVPPFVPSSASALSFVNLNISKAFDELVKILSSFSPQIAMMANMPLAPPSAQGEPPLTLKAGIIDHLGSQIIVTQSMDESAGGTSPAVVQPDSLVALAVSDRSALEKTLLYIHSNLIAPGKPDARRELLGHTIYLVELGGMLPGFGPAARPPMQAPLATGAPSMPKLAFTVTDTHLIFAGEDAVEQAIRTLSSGGGESVASTKWFARAKSSIPSAVGLAGLQDIAASGEFIWSALHKMNKPAQGGAMIPAGILPQGLSLTGTDLFDFSLLPEFEAVKKYFGSSASYGVARQDGFFFEFKYLNPQ